MTIEVHTTKEIKFESEEGELDLIIDERGLTIRTFRVGESSSEPSMTKQLPTSMAVEMRNFLVYALWDHDEGGKS